MGLIEAGLHHFFGTGFESAPFRLSSYTPLLSGAADVPQGTFGSERKSLVKESDAATMAICARSSQSGKSWKDTRDNTCLACSLTGEAAFSH